MLFIFLSLRRACGSEPVDTALLPSLPCWSHHWGLRITGYGYQNTTSYRQKGRPSLFGNKRPNRSLEKAWWGWWSPGVAFTWAPASGGWSAFPVPVGVNVALTQVLRGPLSHPLGTRFVFHTYYRWISPFIIQHTQWLETLKLPATPAPWEGPGEASCN